ncbi:MAG: YlbF family regulator [Thermoactinomyces sp.]|jgi:cell fate (sporulation/competence/biofilm development) regulator YlbF (YheA/YmcA/DUF963 family)
MVNPYDHAHQLARSIRASQPYQDMKEAKRKLEENPKFREMLEKFTGMRLNMQTLYMQGKEPSPEQKEEMEKLTTAIQGVPAITAYLQAEERLMVLLQDLQRIIMEPVEDLFGKGNK